MAVKKSLRVPQNGTQPSTPPELSPIDNMLSTPTPSPVAEPVSEKKVLKRRPSLDRRPTSFNMDRETVRLFKAICTERGHSMSSLHNISASDRAL